MGYISKKEKLVNLQKIEESSSKQKENYILLMQQNFYSLFTGGLSRKQTNISQNLDRLLNSNSWVGLSFWSGCLYILELLKLIF